MNNSLQRLLDLQELLMVDVLGFPERGPEGTPFRKAMTLAAITWLMQEANEALEVSLNVKGMTKPWKQDNDNSHEQFMGEIIDVLFLLLEIFNIIEANEEEIVTAYIEKFRKNVGRALAADAISEEDAEKTLRKANEVLGLKS